jgi:oxygen-independent coproporphyrinogen-3 oxidase
VSAQHLYIHVPFCTRRCSYCDFAIAVRRTVPVDEYLTALAAELGQAGSINADSLDTVYLGGGTPSRLGIAGISKLLDMVRERFSIAENAEVTIEANPEDISVAATAGWAAAGVNRLSIGIQSFDDNVLSWMHRVHTAEHGMQAVRDARAGGIENVSVDLIFALPESLDRSWRDDLEKALDLEPDHVSLYGLTIEPATPVARWQSRGAVLPADEERYASDFLLADGMATERGFVHYEVSNFARPGKQSRHNSAYWTGAPYIGVGPSAHSYDGSKRWWNVPAYAEWVRRIGVGESTVAEEERLTPDNRAAERVYLGLRTVEGFAATGPDLEKAKGWSDSGWARVDRDVVRLTPEGWLRLDSLASVLTGF